MMQFIQNDNTTLEKEKLCLVYLEKVIKEDKNKKDYKSLKYHTMAYEGTLEKIKELESVIWL